MPAPSSGTVSVWSSWTSSRTHPTPSSPCSPGCSGRGTASWRWGTRSSRSTGSVARPPGSCSASWRTSRAEGPPRRTRHSSRTPVSSPPRGATVSRCWTWPTPWPSPCAHPRRGAARPPPWRSPHSTPPRARCGAGSGSAGSSRTRRRLGRSPAASTNSVLRTRASPSRRCPPWRCCAAVGPSSSPCAWSSRRWTSPTRWWAWAGCWTPRRSATSSPCCTCSRIRAARTRSPGC